MDSGSAKISRPKMAYHVYSPSGIWHHHRFLSFFYCIRGLDLPFKTAVKQTTKSFTVRDWLWWTWFALANLVKFVCTIVTSVFFTGADKEKLGNTHLFVQIYESSSHLFIIVCLLGNVASVLQKRKVLFQWTCLTNQQPVKGLQPVNNKAKLDKWGIHLTKACTLATYLFAGYYAEHVWNSRVGPTISFVVCEFAYLELMYNVDTTAVTLSYIAQNYQDLACEVKKISEDKAMKPGLKKQALIRLFSDWVVLKRITQGVSNAAAPYLIPHLFWEMCSASLKIYYFTQAGHNKINTPVKFWFQIVSLAVRVFIMGVLFVVGQSVSSEVSEMRYNFSFLVFLL
jgi:hypothetical protein